MIATVAICTWNRAALLDQTLARFLALVPPSGTMWELLVVNNNPGHPQYRQWEGFTLSDTNRLQVLIPPKFGNGRKICEFD